MATPGKMALRIVVSDLSGRRISFWRASVRAWVKIISGSLTGTLIFIIAGLTPKKQALHDLIAGTVLYRAHRSSVHPAGPTGSLS